MEEFEISGNGDFINIKFDQVFGFPDHTCHWGGYDLNCSLKIEVSDFKVNSTFNSSTGEIHNFYQALSKANTLLNGTVYFSNYEDDLTISMTYKLNGQITVIGTFSKSNPYSSKLHFEYETDQSYIQSTLKQLNTIIVKYGDDKGIM